ncbi:MAG TPA: hypothetical protein VMV57_04055 [Terracidiphilus sp.]|nr:hypothetical protein [Terracidiphilus sp.]
MHQEAVAAMHECARLSEQGKISFPEVVRKLAQMGVERYHTDLCCEEHVYYMPNGEVHVEPMGLLPEPIAAEFFEAGVASAIQAIQRGEIQYTEFLRRIMAAGCVGYFVLIAGRQAQYFGRKGEMRVEKFPAPANHHV